jgi:hypothetical protein
VTLAVLGLAGLAVLGAVYRRAGGRAFWLGFAIFGGIYLFATWEIQFGMNATPVGKWLPDPNRPPLLTAILLERVQPVLGPERGIPMGGSFLEYILADRRDKAILAALERPVAMPFPNETPLADVIRYVQSVTMNEQLPRGIPIYVDPAGLQEAEKTMMSAITFDLEGVALKHSLRLLLRQLDLTYALQDGIMRITYIGAKDSEVGDAFQRVGHGLFTVLFGGIGGIAGYLLYMTRDRGTGCEGGASRGESREGS